ncbi:MAG: thiamine ABC transporter substrate-binding protein, partial [Spirochaetia bacterium]|nr:thiamine ABC transporter substrate-binding protein [Spirochaetia bacterium]
MKKFILIFLIVFLIMFSVSCAKKSEVSENLVIYAYDSFISEWGPGPKVFPLFEEKTGIGIEIVSPGDSGQVLSRLIFEAENPEADIVIGIDNNMVEKAISAGILEKYESSILSEIDDKLVFDKSHHVTPYDYGFFSIIYDSDKISDPPSSLDDLLDNSYSKSIILMDPR